MIYICFFDFVMRFMVRVVAVVPATKTIEGANINSAINWENKNTIYEIARNPKIVNQLLLGKTNSLPDS